jgi:hypothetical protein
MHSKNSALAFIAIVFVIMIIDAIGWKRLPKPIRFGLEKAGRKLVRLQRENPMVSLELHHAPGERQRQDAILDWLDRTEANRRNGEQELWYTKALLLNTRRMR